MAFNPFELKATHDAIYFTRQSHQASRVAYAPFIFALLILVHGANAATVATTIRVGYPQLNGGQVPLWNIPENKLDQKYNLDIKPVYIPGGVRLTQSALSGAVDIAMTGGAAVNAMLSGDNRPSEGRDGRSEDVLRQSILAGARKQRLRQGIVRQ